MKLAHPIISKPMEFVENKANVLVIENRKEFAKIAQELVEESVSGIGQFVFSHENKDIDIKKKVVVITNPFEMDFNQKKISSGLQAILCKNAKEETNFEQTQELMRSLNVYIDGLISSTDYPMDYQEVDVESIVKAINPTIPKEWENTLERIVDFVKYMKGLLDISCFVFINLCLFLSEDELELLMQTIKYEKYQVLFLETVCPNKRDDFAMWVIDKDLCEIVY